MHTLGSKGYNVSSGGKTKTDQTADEQTYLNL